MIGRLLIGTGTALIMLGVAYGAEIRLEGTNVDGVPVVSVRGELVVRDIERFADVTRELDRAIVAFSSPGGSLSAGIEMGTRIRLRGYETVVADGQECYSACALAWLGGTTRFVGRGAKVGFHAAYLERGGRLQETGVGNAVVGGYAANLGLRTPAIIFLTSAPPDGFNYLTEDLARRLGISAEFVDSDQLVLVTKTSNSVKIPSEISARIAKECNEQMPTDMQTGEIQRLDLNGNGKIDYVVDYAGACENLSMICGTGGCLHDVWLSQAHGVPELVFSDTAFGIDHNRVGEDDFIAVYRHGSACGLSGSHGCIVTYQVLENRLKELQRRRLDP